MFDNILELQALAKVADYDRLVVRLLREREALAAVTTTESDTRRGRGFRPFDWRHPLTN